MASQHLLPRSYIEDIIQTRIPDLSAEERAQSLYVLDRLCPNIDGHLRYEDTCYMLGRAGCAQAAHRLSQYIGPTDAEITIRPYRGLDGRPERFNNLFWPGNVIVEGDLHTGGGSVMGRLNVKGDLVNRGFLLAGEPAVEGRIFGAKPIHVGTIAPHECPGETVPVIHLEDILAKVPSEEVPLLFQCLLKIQPPSESPEMESSPAYH